MNEQELRDFKAKRKPSPQLERFDVTKLHCYGCAHSASSAEFPGMPSGERPCCTCIRNPDREERTRGKNDIDSKIIVDDQGAARSFDAFGGNAYNGAPYVYFPMDNYVTLDHSDQERFFDEHPEYAKAISFDGAGNAKVVEP